MAIKICFANQKGGVAKTTTSVSTARALAAKGKKVLVVDTDQQANATFGLGVTVDEGAPTLFQLFEQHVRGGRKADVASAIVHAKGVDVIPSSWELASIELSFNQLGKESMLAEILRQVDDVYDYILVDTPPNLGLAVLNALTAADWLVIPCTPTLWGNAGINELLKSVAMVTEYCQAHVAVAGVLITDAESRTNSARANMTLSEAIADGGDFRVFDVKIPHSVKVREAADSHTDIVSMDPGSKPAIAYEAFAEELERLVA